MTCFGCAKGRRGGGTRQWRSATICAILFSDKERDIILQILHDTLTRDATSTIAMWNEVGYVIEPEALAAAKEATRLTTVEGPLFTQMPSLSEPGTVEQPINLNLALSVTGSILAHALLLAMKRQYFPSLEVEQLDDSQAVMRRVSEVDWDIGIISEANRPLLPERIRPKDREPLVVGRVVTGRYMLRSLAPDIQAVREVYHFGGEQSRRSLEDLFQQYPDLRDTKVSTGSIAHFAHMIQQLSPTTAIFAKDPIGRIYGELLPGRRDLNDLAFVPVSYCLIGSRRFLSAAGESGVLRLGSHLKALLQSSIPDPSGLVNELKVDGIIGKLGKYLGALNIQRE